MPVIDLGVRSTAIQQAMYDEETEMLTITFKDGSSHDYWVDEPTALGLATAPSPGAYFNANIRGIAG
jgi:hypothetical protein